MAGNPGTPATGRPNARRGIVVACWSCGIRLTRVGACGQLSRLGVPEAELLTGHPVRGGAQAITAAREILQYGRQARQAIQCAIPVGARTSRPDG